MVTLASAQGVTATFSSSGPATGGLVAAYAFDEGTGTVVSDASGNSQNGTISGSAWASSGKYGSALSFNGTNNWVSIPDSDLLDLSTGLTVEAWVNPAATPTSWKTIIMKEAPGFYVYALYISPSSHPAIYIVINGQEQGFEVASTTMPINMWSHLAGTFDGAMLRLYVNGIQVGSQAVSATIPATTGVLRIGGNSIWGKEYFNGTIDDVRIYNRSLTAAEIQADLNTPVWNPSTSPALSYVAINPDTLEGGNTSTATVAIGGPAPTGGAVVTLTSSNTSVAQVPSSITIPAGSTNANFAITTSSVTAATPVTVSAVYGGVTKTTILTVNPVVALSTLSVSPTTVTGGTSSQGTVTISGPAPTGGAVITLTSSNTSVALVPSSVTIPAGSTNTNFMVSTSSVATTNLVSINGTYSGVNQNANLTVTPQATAGLVAAYAFGEGAGTVVSDASGNGQNGTITGSTWTSSGKNGSGLSFNGTSNWVTIPDSNLLDVSTGLTMEAWVYQISTANRWKSIIMKEAPGYYVYALYISPSNHPSIYIVIGGQERGFEVTSTTIPLNTWNHLAGTFDGTMLRLYLNGTQIGSQAVTATIPASSGVLRIGGNSIWGAEYFNGTIDDVRIYNRSLTAAGIQADMNTPVGN
jgi:hypothetical protein